MGTVRTSSGAVVSRHGRPRRRSRRALGFIVVILTLAVCRTACGRRRRRDFQMTKGRADSFSTRMFQRNEVAVYRHAGAAHRKLMSAHPSTEISAIRPFSLTTKATVSPGERVDGKLSRRVPAVAGLVTQRCKQRTCVHLLKGGPSAVVAHLTRLRAFVTARGNVYAPSKPGFDRYVIELPGGRSLPFVLSFLTLLGHAFPWVTRPRWLATRAAVGRGLGDEAAHDPQGREGA